MLATTTTISKVLSSGVESRLSLGAADIISSAEITRFLSRAIANNENILESHVHIYNEVVFTSI